MTHAPRDPDTAAAHPAGPSPTPILRIEAGQHVAPIRRVDVDAAGQRLVTGSDDRTVRVWQIPETRLIAILRPPIGDGDEGKIFAVALSPDGTLVAAAGATGATWDGTHCIYLFDAETGEMHGRLTGLGNVVLDLAFSPDGRSLAASLGGGAGIRGWRTADWADGFADPDYGGDSYGLAFDRAGMLATTATDGLIRLYDPTGRRIAARPAPHGTQPYGIAFAPDGDRLVIGYADGPKVSVIGAGRLMELYAPDTGGLSDGDLAGVAWSGDGQSLFAAGRCNNGTGVYPIRRWSDAGRGRHEDLPAATNTIMDIRALGATGVVFGSAGPAFGSFDASGRSAIDFAAVTPDLRGALGDHFKVSHDGLTVRVAYDPSGGKFAAFALPDRRLAPDAADDPSLAPPRTRSPQLVVEAWQDSAHPTVNGAPIALEPQELSRSLAIAPDADGFVLGTDYQLRAYGADGRLRWQATTPGTVWGVNISGDGRRVIAALDDGTLRWHRLADGTPELALYIHRLGGHWVLWTPDGLYDTAPGCDDLIGWHVNRGAADEADFFPASIFRTRFHRPDEIDRALGLTPDRDALLGELPPVVTIVSPRPGTACAGGAVPVSFRLRSPSGLPVLALRAYIDDQPLQPEPLAVPAPDADGLHTLTLEVPPGTERLGLVAETGAAVGRAAWLGFQGAPPFTGLPVVTATTKPVLYLLAVGVNGFIGGENTLQFATKDAADFADVMHRQAGGLYRDVQVHLLNHGRVNREEIIRGLDWLRASTTREDVAVVFFAGHGVNDIDGSYHFLPETGDLRALRATAVSGGDVAQVLGTTRGKRIAFLDTCHAGNVLAGAGGAALSARAVVNLDRLVRQLTSAEAGVVVFASSAPTQDSYESPAWQNGAFTEALLEGLSGMADMTADRAISIGELGFYLPERVSRLTNGIQNPIVLRPTAVRDFPFALVVPVLP